MKRIAAFLVLIFISLFAFGYYGGVNLGYSVVGGSGYSRAIAVVTEWLPSALNPLQWLSSISGTEAIDQTANELDADVTGVNIVTTDGVGDYCQFTPNAEWAIGDYIEGSLLGTDPSVYDAIFACNRLNGPAYKYIILDCSSSLVRLTLSSGDGASSIIGINTVDPNGKLVYFKITRTSVGFDYYTDVGGTVASGSTTLEGSFDPFDYAGNKQDIYLSSQVTGATPYAVEWYDFKFVKGGTPFIQYVFESGLGMGTKEPDISGNGIDGTWSTGAGGTTTLRSGTSDDVTSHNLINGFSPFVEMDAAGRIHCGNAGATLTHPHINITMLTTVNGLDWILMRRDAAAGTSNDYQILQNSGGTLAFGVANAGSVATTSTLPLNTWIEIEAWYDGADVVVRFRSLGDTAWTDTGTTTIGAVTVPGHATALILGGNSWSTGLGMVGKLHRTILSDHISGTVYHDWNVDSGGTYFDSVGGVNGTYVEDAAYGLAPALADGSDDTVGLGITNPGGYVHNGFEGFLRQKAANTEFLDNEFWSADGINYDEKSFEDLLTHIDLDNNVVAVDDGEFITEVITEAQSAMLTPAEYSAYIAWLALQGDSSEHLVPYEVTSGGIGPGDTWYTADGTNIYLIEYVGE